MEKYFQGKTAIVTGAGRGIGCDIVTRFCTYGAKVYAVSQTQANLDSIKDSFPDVQDVCVDLRDWEATRKVVEALPPVDFLVNNAAVAVLAPFLELQEEGIDQTFNVNVKAVFNVSQVVVKKMIESGKTGAIVNISSQASQAAIKNHAAYCASKGALDMLSKVMALELGPHQIRVNCVNPTVVLTDMGRLGWSDPAKSSAMLSNIPLGRFAEVKEVVDAVMFLLSDHSSMVTGATLPVDGGYLAC